MFGDGSKVMKWKEVESLGASFFSGLTGLKEL
jgi:hypothetical protein